MTGFDYKSSLQRIQSILEHHSGDSAEWINNLLLLYSTDKAAFLQQINSKHFWGGAGSIANETLADNPGVDDWVWQTQIREFRELMIALGTYLMSQDNPNPDISSWLLAFNNWNQSEI